jgi:transcriptional regulator with XRE-family HTH domain
MEIRSPRELGQLIRSYRVERRMTQEGLAAAVGASRKWVSEAEAGKPTAEIGRIFRALAVLGVTIGLLQEAGKASSGGEHEEIPEVGEVLSAYRGKA